MPTLSLLPVTHYLWGVLAVLMAAALGFFAGVRHERGAAARALRRARRSLEQLVSLVSTRLREAEEACRLIQCSATGRLSSDQARQIDEQRRRIVESVSRLQSLPLGTDGDPNPRAVEPFSLTWSSRPSGGEFPDRIAFDENLAAMLAAGERSDSSGGLLLVKADRLDTLSRRLSADAVEKLLWKLGGVVCRAARDADLVCRIGPDAFAVLLPDLAEGEGARIAHAVRDSIRHHHFRADESGPEVLLTASLGYSPCHAGDNADLVMNRAGDALLRSQKRGRNQLHLHDGARIAAAAGS